MCFHNHSTINATDSESEHHPLTDRMGFGMQGMD